MSDELSKVYHSKRIQQKENHIKRQLKIAKAHNMPVKEPHMVQDISAVTCGDSNCVMCGNPRKFFNEPTLQEKKFDQTKNWLE